jgi:aerobic-type carbon monoxide dehydrogenase small subunit (CoxS/CutS family)
MSDLEDPSDFIEGVKLPAADGRVAVRLDVNGRSHTLRVRTTQTLLDALREQVKLFGARSGCGVGMCGACTVLEGGRAISGCLTLAALCDGADIRTVEGLEGPDGKLSRVQEAFLRHRAFQCSYCTSGFVLALEALLAREAEPTEAAIREAFSGHLCRCGSYSRIMAASLDAAGIQPAPGASAEDA